MPDPVKTRPLRRLTQAELDAFLEKAADLLRRADCMRILVPWRAFGDLEKCRVLIPQHEAELIAEIERERDTALSEIEEAYGASLAPLPALRQELAERQAFAEKKQPEDKEERKKFREEKKANAERLKELKAAVKDLTKLEAEAEEKRAAARQHADREITLAHEAAADLARICADPAEARRYFVVAEREEIRENEFNLNLPRYVDTFEPEEKIEIDDALAQLSDAEDIAQQTLQLLREKLARLAKPAEAGI